MTISDETPLGEARAWLRKRVDVGERCPCCTQFAKVYRRTIHAAMAVDLIRCWRAHGTDWHDLTAIVGHRGTGDVTKLRYWGLMEPAEGEREDGSHRVGIWRVTELGVLFVRGAATVPKYARLYDGRCLGLDDSEQRSIHDALGSRFNYQELMDA